MEKTVLAGYVPMALLLVFAFIASAFSALGVCREVTGKKASFPKVCLDVCVALHLVMFCLCFRCLEDGAWLFVLPGGVAVHAVDLLWTNAAGSFAAVLCAALDRRPTQLLALFPLVATLPCLLGIYGRLWTIVAALDIAFFSLSMVVPYLAGERWGGQGVGGASPSEVLNLIAHGVLCATGDGRVILLNSVMRDVLSEVGLKTDLGDARAMFRTLVPDGPGHQRAVSLSDGRFFLISEDDSYLETRGWRYAIAYDVSEEEHVNGELRHANTELQAQNRELGRLLRNVLYAAGQEAHLQMRGTVHDVVGQRLSILHRHLEDGDLDDDGLEQIKPLLQSLLEDLKPVSETPPVSELAALADAFACAGVAVEVSGEPSRDVRIARLQVRIVREALTNALRHGHAHRVRIVFGSVDGRASVVIDNDGDLPGDAGIIEGNGLGGLRQAVEAAGGSFAVSVAPRFSIRAEIPLPEAMQEREG